MESSREFCNGVQIDEDTDRDRYMSPLEAKQYGLIDHVIGGDEAGFKASLSFLYFSSAEKHTSATHLPLRACCLHLIGKLNCIHR